MIPIFFYSLVQQKFIIWTIYFQNQSDHVACGLGQRFLQKLNHQRTRSSFHTTCFLWSRFVLWFVSLRPLKIINSTTSHYIQPFKRISQWKYVFLFFWHISIHNWHSGGYLQQWGSEHGTRAPMFITTKEHNEFLTVLRPQQSVLTQFY